jgi:hypothetical protein
MLLVKILDEILVEVNRYSDLREELTAAKVLIRDNTSFPLIWFPSLTLG